MIDITGVDTDIRVLNTDVMRSANILSVQLGSLEYAQDLGIDLEFFLSEEFIFQNESFKAYLVEVLARRGINVSSVIQTVETLFQKYTFSVSAVETDTSLVR